MIDEYFIRVENHLKDIKALLRTIARTKAEPTTLASLGVDDTAAVFEELKRLLGTGEWAQAVDPLLICDESVLAEKQRRAEGITDFMIEESLKGKSFLDFGCGDGLCVREAVRKGAAVAVGYDIEKNWDEDSDNLTTDWKKIVSQGPYDVVFAYDVLDHVVGTPEEMMKQIRSVCKPDSMVYMRCHPWCSRSATHLYRKMNKAYIHLVFTEDELASMGLNRTDPIQEVIHPFRTYVSIFNKAQFEIRKNHPFTEEVEPFFEKNPTVSKRIKARWASSHEELLASGESFPSHQLSIHFIDFVLKPSAG